MLCEVADGRLRYGVIAGGDDRVPGLRLADVRCPAEPELSDMGVGIRIGEPRKGIVVVSVGSDKNLAGPRVATAPDPLVRLAAVATEHGTDGAQDLLARLFDHALAEGTGALVAVVPRFWTGGWPCEDATVLQTPIDLPRLAAEAGPDGVPPVALARYEALAASMIREDGIVVFDGEGRVRAYRWFAPFSPGGEQLSGGARERAFRALEDLVSEGALRAAFIQSSDGTMGFASRETAPSARVRAEESGREGTGLLA